MQLFIVSDDFEFHVDVPVEYSTLIQDQLNRIQEDEERTAFTEAFLKQLARVISQFFDYDYQPPTEKQVIYATSLGIKHKVEVPRDALIYKSAMCDFLDKYSGKKRSK